MIKVLKLKFLASLDIRLNYIMSLTTTHVTETNAVSPAGSGSSNNSVWVVWFSVGLVQHNSYQINPK